MSWKTRDSESDSPEVSLSDELTAPSAGGADGDLVVWAWSMSGWEEVAVPVVVGWISDVRHPGPDGDALTVCAGTAVCSYCATCLIALLSLWRPDGDPVLSSGVATICALEPAWPSSSSAGDALAAAVVDCRLSSDSAVGAFVLICTGRFGDVCELSGDLRHATSCFNRHSSFDCLCATSVNAVIRVLKYSFSA